MNSTRYSSRTHVGLKRKLNEDSILALPDHQIWFVADGMGGHEGGDFASRTITETVAALSLDLAPTERMRALRDALHLAHELIRAEGDAREVRTIGSTVVTFMVAAGHFACFWAGDSRLYRLQSGLFEMLTQDHSVVSAFVEAGQMTWDEAEAHPYSNAVTRAVGVGDALELDKIHGEVFPGDRFLLCSDGLTKYALEATLKQILSQEPIETVTERLQNIALKGGGADNISVIVIDVL